MAEDVKSSQDGSRAAEPPHTNNILGGATITVISLLFLAGSFAVSTSTVMFRIGSFDLSSTSVPRLLTLVVTAIGVAVMVNLIRVRAPQDFYGGLALILLAAFALIASAELPGQRGFAFGPGTAPRLFALILAGLGAAVTVVGLIYDGPAIEKYRIRGPALVIVAIFLFAALIRPFGLIIATYLAFMVSILGSREMRWIESTIAAAAMTTFCWVLFVKLLGLPFQLWPQPNGPQILIHQFEEIMKHLWFILTKLLHLA